MAAFQESTDTEGTGIQSYMSTSLKSTEIRIKPNVDQSRSYAAVASSYEDAIAEMTSGWKSDCPVTAFTPCEAIIIKQTGTGQGKAVSGKPHRGPNLRR